MIKCFMLVLLASFCGFSGINTWTKITPSYNYPAQVRTWSTLIPDTTGKLLVMSGVGPTANGTYCIYSNALVRFDVLNATGNLLKQSNYQCNYGLPIQTALNATDPTPMDRHTYNQMAYSPVDNSIYLAHGASGSGNHPHDFWQYSMDSSRWYNLGAAPDQTANWDCACEVNLIYAEGELWYFKNCRDVFVYNVQSKSWRTLRIGEDRYAVTPLGAKGIFDPTRKTFVFYGGMYPGPSNLMATLNKASLTWSTSNGPRALKYAAMAYSEKKDLYFVGAAGQDTVFVYDPKTSAWKSPVIGGTTGPGDRYVEFAYSDSLDLLVTLKGLDLYTMQYQDLTPLPPPPTGDSCVSDTVVFRDTVMVRDTIRFIDTVMLSPPTKKGVFKVGSDTLLILDILN